MITITIDGKTIEVNTGMTVLAAAESAGIKIPTLCYLESCAASGSCMVCAVLDLATGKMLPACTARCEDGMNIAASSKAVAEFRRGVIELLLNEHRGDCLAPCQSACPYNIDISTIMHLSVRNRFEGAIELLLQTVADPHKICSECPAPCQVACRRGRYDKPLAIRQTIMDLTVNLPLRNIENPHREQDKSYRHRLGLITEHAMTMLLTTKNYDDSLCEAARCLRCDCRSRDNCRLRQLASEYNAEQKRFGKSSVEFNRIIYGAIGYEIGKCIKCGNCIAVGERLKPGIGPVFVDRGSALAIGAPIGVDNNELFEVIAKECLEVCPTGALFLSEEQ